MHLLEPFGGGHAIQQRHCNVEDNYIWFEFPRGGEQGASIAHGAYHLAMGLQQFLERLQQESVIVR